MSSLFYPEYPINIAVAPRHRPIVQTAKATVQVVAEPTPYSSNVQQPIVDNSRSKDPNHDFDIVMVNISCTLEFISDRSISLSAKVYTISEFGK